MPQQALRAHARPKHSRSQPASRPASQPPTQPATQPVHPHVCPSLAGVAEAIKTHLLPLATIVTPNIPEASKLLGEGWSALQRS